MNPTPQRRAAARLTRAALLGSLWFAGCGSPSSPPPGILLGTGESEFEPWEGEPRLSLSAGVQGGFHVWVSFLATDFHAYGPSDNLLGMKLLTRVIGVEDSELMFVADLAVRPTELTIEGDSRPALTFPGYPAQIFDARCSHDRRVEVELELTDKQGNRATDQRVAVLDIDEANRGVACD